MSVPQTLYATLMTAKNICTIIPILNTFRSCNSPSSVGIVPVKLLFANEKVSSIRSCPNSEGMVPVTSLFATFAPKDINVEVVGYSSYKKQQ